MIRAGACPGVMKTAQTYNTYTQLPYVVRAHPPTHVLKAPLKRKMTDSRMRAKKALFWMEAIVVGRQQYRSKEVMAGLVFDRSSALT